MKKKIALGLIAIAVIGVLGFKLVNAYSKPAKTVTQAAGADTTLKIDELLVLAQKERKPLVVYVYAKGNCESCTKATTRDLPLVARLNRK